MIGDINAKLNIKEIYAAGMSNGGMFAYRLACEMSDVFTAIAAVSGTNNFASCNPENPISIMHIHGLLDDHVLFDGGKGPESKLRSDVEFKSVPETISEWVSWNQCNNNSERVFENEDAYCDLFSGCRGNVRVKLCVERDGGHSWPGIRSTPSALEKNKPSQAFSATDEIWNFFRAAR